MDKNVESNRKPLINLEKDNGGESINLVKGNCGEAEKSHRKPLIRPVKANWWTDRKFYLLYMLRESTAITSLFVAFELTMLITFPLLGGAFKNFAINFVYCPITAIINLLCLASVMFHAYTWFNLMPLVVRVFKSQDPSNSDYTKFIPREWIVRALWAGCIVANIVVLVTLYLIK